MKQVTLPSGETVPALGLGTWHMGESGRRRDAEMKALRFGLDLGMALIDTAEMYGEGGAEKVVAEAMAGRRDSVFLVSKVYPHNASRKGVVAACERSLKRLATDRLDLYLLHWRGGEPLAETVAGFEALVAAGKIRHWGVSNFDVDDMAELTDLKGGERVATNQVLYNLGRRGVEWDLQPWCRERRIPLMAYSPLDQGAILGKRALKSVAARHDATPAEITLAWLLRQGDIMVIPKASDLEHVRANRGALEIALDHADLTDLDAAFPPPGRRRPLDIL